MGKRVSSINGAIKTGQINAKKKKRERERDRTTIFHHTQKLRMTKT